jgi:hypothetical protein
MDAKKLLRDGRAQFSSFLMIVITGKRSKDTQVALFVDRFLSVAFNETRNRHN